MAISLYGQLAWPLARVLRFDATAQSARTIAVDSQPRALAQRTALRPSAHSLLVDSDGVWSWEPGDAHAAATRHRDVRKWIDEHPGCDMRLWVAGNLLQSLGSAQSTSEADESELRSTARSALLQRHGEHASEWALAAWKSEVAVGICALTGIDLGNLTGYAKQLGVRVRSVVPWWYHAFLEAKRCVAALAKATTCQRLHRGRSADRLVDQHERRTDRCASGVARVRQRCRAGRCDSSDGGAARWHKGHLRGARPGSRGWRRYGSARCRGAGSP